MTGSILYRKHYKTGKRRIDALRINGEERSLVAWGLICGRSAVEIRRRLETMTPYDAVYRDSIMIKPNNAWPVPPSVLAKSRSAA